jgi:hypothetical protein
MASALGRWQRLLAHQAGWVAVVLEKAAVIMIDCSRPAHIGLRPGW